jgi:hypothetical protein
MDRKKFRTSQITLDTFLFLHVPSSIFIKMAEIANPIIVITGERKKLLLKARLPFLFFPGLKSE